MSKYLWFVLMSDTGKTQAYKVTSARHGSILGEIYWYGQWRQYVFEPTPDTIWNKDCLRELGEFLMRLMADRKHNLEAV